MEFWKCYCNLCFFFGGGVFLYLFVTCGMWQVSAECIVSNELSFCSADCYRPCYFSSVKPTWYTFYSICWYLLVSTYFVHYFLIPKTRYTNGTWYIACLVCQLDAPGLLLFNPDASSSIDWIESALSWFKCTDVRTCYDARSTEHYPRNLQHCCTYSCDVWTEFRNDAAMNVFNSV
jgi:hypothetical protein